MKLKTTINQTKNLLKKSYHLSILLLIPLALIIYSIITSTTHQDILSAFATILNTSIYSFIIVALVSFEFFYKSKSNNLDEIIKSTPNYRKFNISQIIVMLIYCATLFIISTLGGLFICIAYSQFSLLWITEMLLNTLLNFFLIPFTASMISYCLAKRFKRASGYAMLILFVLLTTSLSNDVAYILNESGFNIFSFIMFFDIFSPSLDWTPVYAFGQSILPYRWYIVLFWLFLMSFVVLVKSTNKSKKDAIFTSVSLALTITFLYLSLTPMSVLLLSSDDPQRSIMADQDYYRLLTDNVELQEADFSVIEYDLDIKVANQLEVAATLSVDNNDLDEYSFTLYHGYEIEKVTFDDGTAADFLQDGDYFTIYASNKASESLTIYYRGYNTIYYSNLQGTFLPGYFAYYPLSGKRSVYDMEYYGMSQNRLDEETLFTVKIDSILTVYSNLSNTGDNEFSGYTDGLTLLSGMYETYTDENLTIVYPYLDSQITEQTIIENIIENYGTDYLPTSTKTVLITPSINNISPYTAYCCFSDSVIIQSIYNMDLVYENQVLCANKQALYTTYMIYLNNSEDLRLSLAMQKEQFAANFQDLEYEEMMSSNASYLIIEFLDYYGEDEGRELIEEYLFSADTDNAYWKDFIQID